MQPDSTGSHPQIFMTYDATTNQIADAGYVYDDSGNLTDDVLNEYTYDAENRIKTVNGTGATYYYDGSALRVRKVVGAVTTVYIYSGTKVIAEYENGALQKDYVYMNGKLFATFNSGTVHYHHTDHLSTRVVTQSTVGDETSREFGHYPFGGTWYEDEPLALRDKFKFTSYERDSESGLDYATFRFDSSRLGRFMTPDPIAGNIFNPQSLNRYGYVVNDPINLVDPLGLCLGLECLIRDILINNLPSFFGGNGEGWVGGGSGDHSDDFTTVHDSNEPTEHGPSVNIDAITQLVKNQRFRACTNSATESVNFDLYLIALGAESRRFYTSPGGGLIVIGGGLVALSLAPTPDAPLTLPERAIVGGTGVVLVGAGIAGNTLLARGRAAHRVGQFRKEIKECEKILQ